MEIRKNSLIKTAAISFLLTIFLSASAYAQPNITSFSGSLTDGSTITINGNNFGVNGPNIVVFDDFESGTNGNNIKTGAGSATIGQWNGIGGGDKPAASLPKYDNSFKVSGGMAFRGNATIATLNGTTDAGSPAYTNFTATSDIFVSYWYYMPSTSDWSCYNNGICNNKLVWVVNTCCNVDDRVIPTNAPANKTTNNSFYMFGNDSIGEPPLSPSLNMSKGKWYRFWGYLHGAGNATDHEELWVASPSSEANLAATRRINRTTQIWQTTFAGFKRIYINAYQRWCNDCAESAPTFDDVYVAIGTGARARVEIGDAATYATSKDLTIASVTSWSDTSITATIRQGSFSNLNNAYLYVIDADGNVNENGYLLSDGGGNTTPPPPSDSSGSGDTSSSGGSGCGFIKDDGKGQGAKGEGLSFMLMLIIALAGIAIARKVKVRTAKARGKSLSFKTGLIGITVLFLFATNNPANATIYFEDNFNIGDFSGYGAIDNTADGCYSAGQYFADATDFVDGHYSLRFDMDNYPVNQDPCSYISANFFTSPIPEGATVYIAFWTKFSANHYWDDDETNKHLEIRGNQTDTRLIFNIGRWEVGQLQELGLLPADLYTGVPHLTVMANGTGGWRPYNSPDGSSFVQNINMSTPVAMKNGLWHSIVIRMDITSANDGTIEMWINGNKVIEFHGIRTQRNGIMYTGTYIGGTHNQPTYAADMDSSKYYDRYIVTDNWQDIVNGGYLSGGGNGDTPPPSDGSNQNTGSDTSASGGSGCGFVKDDNGKGQKAKGEGLSLIIMLIIILAGIAIARRFSNRYSYNL